MRQAAFVSSLECLPKHDLIGLREVLEAQGGGGVIPFNGRHWESPPERCTLVRRQVYKRVGISLVKISKSIGKSVIGCCKKGYLKWFTDAF